MRIVMIGDGGHGKVVRELIEQAPGMRLAAVLDDRYAGNPAERAREGERTEGVPITRTDGADVSPGSNQGGTSAKWPDGDDDCPEGNPDGIFRGPTAAWRMLLDRDPELQFVAAIGDNRMRGRIVRAMEAGGARFARLIHPAAIVSPRAKIGAGAVIMARAVVQPDAEVGTHAIVNTGAIIEHDSRLGDCAHAAPGSVLTGGVRAGEGVLVGAGAVILPKRTVGDWAAVGAGAVVTRDVPAHCTVAGVPAVVIKQAGILAARDGRQAEHEARKEQSRGNLKLDQNLAVRSPHERGGTALY